jgi:hypothetical protein
MIWRTAFVAVLLTVLLVACGDKYRGICLEQPRTKNKSLAVTGTTRYGDPYVQAASCP